MRKLLLISVFIFIAACSKDEEPTPPVVVELEPTIELSISPSGVIPYGGEVGLTIKTTNSKSVTINGEPFPLLDGIRIFTKLVMNTELIVVATNVNKSITSKKIVTVGDWTTSKTGLLIHNGKSWTDKENIYVVNGIVVGIISASNKDKRQFFIDGTYKIYDENDKFLSSDKWSFADNETKLVFGDPKIFPAYPMPVLNTVELWLDQNTVWLG